MRLKSGRLILIPTVLLLSLPSCGKKSAENTGFTETLGETTVDDYITATDTALSSLWTAVVAALKTNEIDTSSSSALSTSLGAPSVSQFISVDASRTTYQNEQVAAYLGSASQQWCQTKPAGFTIINPGKAITPALTTGGFKIDTDGKTPKALAADVNVYLAKYNLGTTAAPSADRYMFVTIPAGTPSATVGGIAPDGTAYGFPLVNYAHAGVGGLAYEEIAAAFGELQTTHIVMAPVFPGEPVCKTYDTGTTTCTGTNILVAASTTDTSKVFENDVIDYLGAFECVKKLTTVTTVYATAPTTPVGTEAISTKWAKISAADSSAAFTGYSTTIAGGAGTSVATGCTVTSSPYYAACVGALGVYLSAKEPLTYTVGLGRGGNVVNLALARAGGLNSILASTATDTTTAAYKAAINGTAVSGVYPGITLPEMFSCAATVAPQASFVAGFNKLMLESWVKKETAYIPTAKWDALNAGVPGFSAMKTKIGTYLADATLTTDALKAASIATYIKNVDGVMHIPLAHGALMNWGKFFTGKLATPAESLNTVVLGAGDPNGGKTIEDAQGAWLMLHGRADLVSNISNTQLFSAVGVSVSKAAMAQGTTAQTVPGINWLALEVTPLSGVTDNGHVANASFLGGKTVVDASSKSASNITPTTAYEGLAPGVAIGTWLSSAGACYTASNGQADTVNDATR